MKIAIAMSGGIDSSVAAAMLKEAGYEVTSVTMQITSSGDGAADASEVAHRLKIPHHVLNFQDFFGRRVIDSFCREYSLGRTPNPCVLCNRYIKFGILRERAREMGVDFIATGHYAAVEKDERTGRYLLKKGTDTRKDQSYFLCQLTQEQLSRVMFPIGHLTKGRVRAIARELGLPVVDRRESREICFIPDGNYAGFLKDRLPEAFRPGPILDREGTTIGEHQGTPGYTIGQRHGLGIANAEPLYVIDIAPDRNAVTAGTKDMIYGTELIASNLNWIAVSQPEHPIEVKAKIRYNHPEAEAIIKPVNCDSVYVKFAEPQMAITPGQTIAFYDGDSVIGGGTILRQGR